MSETPTPKPPRLMFESYNGMSRPAMFLNIPIMPLVGLLMGGLIAGVLGSALFSWIWGLVFALPFASALIALRLMCSIDGQYLRRVRFALRRLWFNLKYGKALLLTSSNPKWSQFYGKRYSQQRYAAPGESASAGLPGRRVHLNAGGQQAGEPDPVQGHRAQDAQR